jgi:hypothetical protein
MAVVIEQTTHLELDGELLQLFEPNAKQPNIPEGIIRLVFERAGLVRAIRGPDRLMVVFTFLSDRPDIVHIRRGPPHPPIDKFSREVHDLYHSYRVGEEVPVIISRVKPSYTGVLVCPIGGLSDAEGPEPGPEPDTAAQ